MRKLFSGKKAQTIATEQIINISKLSFEAAKISNLSSCLSSGVSAWAPKGIEQIFSTWWFYWASGMTEEQAEHWTLPSFPPLACALHSLCLGDGKGMDHFREFTRLWGSCQSVLLCKAQQTEWHGPSTTSGSCFLLFPLGTVEAGSEGMLDPDLFQKLTLYYTSLLLSPCPNIITV